MSAAVGRVLAALAKAGHAPRQRGEGKWIASCPAHEDRTASLSVADGRKGALLNCSAGCETADILDAIGLCWPDPFDEPRRRRWVR